MNSALMFSKQSDEWSTPDDLWRELDREFCFEMDVAATRENAKMLPCITREMDALAVDWFDAFCDGDATLDRMCGTPPPICWLNPPYSRCAEFIAKAAEEASKGCTVVCLIPARTDTKYWHAHIWDKEKHQPRPGVEVRLLKGRLKFGGSKNSAPFPSAVIVFRGTSRGREPR